MFSSLARFLSGFTTLVAAVSLSFVPLLRLPVLVSSAHAQDFGHADGPTDDPDAAPTDPSDDGPSYEDALTTPDDPDAAPSMHVSICPEGEFWFDEACRDAFYIGNGLGLADGAVEHYEVYGLSPTTSEAHSALLRRDLPGSGLDLGAIVRVYYHNGDAAVLHVRNSSRFADSDAEYAANPRPRVVHSREVHVDRRMGGWTFVTEATYSPDADARPVFTDPNSVVLPVGPESMFVPDTPATWWEMRGTDGVYRTITYGTDHPVFGVAITMDHNGSSLCDTFEEDVYNATFDLCAKKAEAQYDSYIFWQSTFGVLGGVAISGAGITVVAVGVSGATAVNPALGVAAGGAAAGAVPFLIDQGVTFAQDWIDSSMEKAKVVLDSAVGQDGASGSCGREANQAGNAAARSCAIQVGNAEATSATVLQFVMPSTASGPGDCPPGSFWAAAGTPLLSCKRYQVQIAYDDDGETVEETTTTRECASETLSEGACIAEYYL